MEFSKTFYNAETNIWSGRKKPKLYHPNVSIGQIILNALELRPNRVIQISYENGIEVTTDQLRIRSIRAAIQLLKLNLTNDDCIGIVAMNNTDLAPIIIAALLIGVPIHPLDPIFDNADILHHFKLSRPRIIFCDFDVYDRVKMSVDQIGLNCIFVTFDKRLSGAQFIADYFQPDDNEDEFIPVQIKDGKSTIALIVCSSGTTGLSKAVCLPHAGISERLSSLWKQSYDDVYLCFSSIYWMSGLMSVLFGSVTCCKRIITKKRFTCELFFELVEKYRITQVLGPPSNLGLVFKHSQINSVDLSSIKSYLCGGSLVPEEYAHQMKQYLINSKLYIAYGMSEIPGLVTFNATDNSKSVGHVTYNNAVKIINDDGQKLGINENGEIVIKPEFLFLGYKGEPELTKSVLGLDGWVYSGDLGYFDQNGMMYVTGRKKDILKYRSFTVSPSEIEEFLLKHKFIKQICIVGLPDLISGDLPAAVLEKIGNDDNKTIEETVYNLVKENLADYKLLRGGVYVVDALPMTPSGKIQRSKVLEMIIELNKGKIG